MTYLNSATFSTFYGISQLFSHGAESQTDQGDLLPCIDTACGAGVTEEVWRPNCVIKLAPSPAATRFSSPLQSAPDAPQEADKYGGLRTGKGAPSTLKKWSSDRFNISPGPAL